MESIIRDKVLDHMVSNNLLSKKQHGFVPLRNCIFCYAWKTGQNSLKTDTQLTSYIQILRKHLTVFLINIKESVTRLTRKSVKSQEMNIAKKVKTNNKLFWKFVSSKTKLKPSIPDLFISSKADPNLMTNDDQTKSELRGKSFSSVFLKEPQWIWDLTDEDKPIVSDLL